MHGSTTQESLIDFAVRVYGDDGVQRACLDAQDTLAMDVNLLLWGAWSAVRGEALDAQAIADAVSRCQTHREQQVLPLRERRRALADRPAEAAAYEEAKAAELEAEFRQLSMLEAQKRSPGIQSGTAGPDLLAFNLRAMREYHSLDESALDALGGAMNRVLFVDLPS